MENATDSFCLKRNNLFVSMPISTPFSLFLNVSIINCTQKASDNHKVSFYILLKVDLIESLSPVCFSSEK